MHSEHYFLKWAFLTANQVFNFCFWIFFIRMLLQKSETDSKSALVQVKPMHFVIEKLSTELLTKILKCHIWQYRIAELMYAGAPQDLTHWDLDSVVKRFFRRACIFIEICVSLVFHWKICISSGKKVTMLGNELIEYLMPNGGTRPQWVKGGQMVKASKSGYIQISLSTTVTTTNTGLILGLRPANERHYKVTPSLIGWMQT